MFRWDTVHGMIFIVLSTMVAFIFAVWAFDKYFTVSCLLTAAFALFIAYRVAMDWHRIPPDLHDDEGTWNG